MLIECSGCPGRPDRLRRVHGAGTFSAPSSVDGSAEGEAQVTAGAPTADREISAAIEVFGTCRDGDEFDRPNGKRAIVPVQRAASAHFPKTLRAG